MDEYTEKLDAFYTDRIHDAVNELRTLCRRAEDAWAFDRYDEYWQRVAEIGEKRPVLQTWYRQRRDLRAKAVEVAA